MCGEGGDGKKQEEDSKSSCYEASHDRNLFVYPIIERQRGERGAAEMRRGGEE